ncbi:MAG: hypothetical protein ABFR05_07380 [Bacteroidota bacterium]
MNLIEFSEILQYPHQIENGKIDDLENITKEFPFFQAAQALYLNGLKKQKNYKYNDFLKRTAAYTTDRSILFEFITSKKIDLENFISKEEQSEKQADVTELIENKVSLNKEIESNTLEQDQETEKGLPINKPFQFQTNDSFSFNEWLKLTSVKPIERSKPGEKSEEISVKESTLKEGIPKSNFALIDKFIADNPKIKPAETIENSNFASQSITENSSLMTETLAHVYLAQKKYSKAITAFNILSLKYPEKSSFFANQIEEIKKIQQK